MLKRWLAPLTILFVYCLTHFWQLTILPVFADESIYIRWTQLIMDDWQRYLFFPLNDGKTPLHMWLLLPGQYLFSDPLWAARMLSVLIGMAQMAVVGWTIRLMGGRAKTSWLGMALTTILPFWFFHHRMALMDALLTLWISLTFALTLRLAQAVTEKSKEAWLFTALAGISFGLSLWSKLPALLFLPGLFLPVVFLPKLSLTQRRHYAVYVAITSGIGLFIFALLKLHPAFGQLFGRGNDFLFPWREVLLEGGWLTTIKNVPSYLRYFGAYATIPVLILAGVGLFLPKLKHQQHLLIWSAVIFALPVVLLGRVVYPRYLLPVMFFLTVAAALATQTIIDRYITGQKKLITRAVTSLVLVLLLANTINQSAIFVAYQLINPDRTPFVSSDREQYLLDWSSGHGITQSVALIQELAQTQTVAVATEGRFGTLPDAVLMYLHGQDLSNIYVEGIGYPVKSFSPEFIARAREFDTVLLLINSHRRELELSDSQLLQRYCRPDSAPCLEVWDVTKYVHTLGSQQQ